VHDDIGSVVERSDEIRRRHRVVDDQRDAGLVRDLGDRRDVESVEPWIADRLGENELRVRPESAAKGLWVAGVDEGELESEARKRVDKEIVRAAVELVAETT